MAGTMQSLWLVRSSGEKDWPHNKSPHRPFDLLWKEYFRASSQWWDNRTCKAGPAYPGFTHKFTKEPLWIDGRYNPSWVSEKLGCRGPLVSVQAPARELCKWNSMGTAFVALPRSQASERYNTAVHDEGTAFVALLRACTKNKDLYRGTRIHDDILQRGLLQKCSDALVTMYAKCGALAKAQALLDLHKSRDVISWTALIAGYARERQSQDAFNCFECMQREGVSPNAVTYACILKACGNIGAADKGKQIHDEILRQGLLQNNVMLGTALVDMYAKCGALQKAERVLEQLPSRNVVSWSALIAGYVQQGQSEQALDLFERMQCEAVPPDGVIYACVLKACGTIGAVDKGKQIHDEIVRQGLLQNDIVLGTALVDMYAKCGALEKAEHVLEELPSRNVVSWSALIAGYAQQGQSEQALDCFERMQCEGIPPDAVTYTCILKACGTVGAADKGKQIHDKIARQGLLQDNIVLGTALVDMYAKCGALSKAEHMLEELPCRDVVSWNALIAGYTQHGQGQQALACFERMQWEDIPADAVTYACILKACGTIGAVEKGTQIHYEIERQGLLQDNIVLGNALVDMYAKCGALENAERVLEGLPSWDVFSWNALIAGYTQNGQSDQALECFERMQREGIPPDAVIYACVLKACGSTGASDKGKQIHDEIARQGLLRDNIVLGTALVDMYAKCGAMAKAEHVLEELSSRNVVSWNALIAGYVQQGQGEQALDCFERMQHEGIPPDVATFGCVLNVCSHLGLVEEAHKLFKNMITKFGVKPDLESYNCIIDLLGRAGHLEKAVRLIGEMPSSDFSAIWHALLGACWKWGDANVGRWAFDQAVQVDKEDGASYVLMANIYAAAGMQENAENIEAMRMVNKAWKKPGCSRWIDLSGDVHVFCVGDTKHAQSKIMNVKLEDIAHEMSQRGFYPGLQGVSPDISNAAGKHLLCCHSEKLALACGLINTTSREKYTYCEEYADVW